MCDNFFFVCVGQSAKTVGSCLKYDTTNQTKKEKKKTKGDGP